MKNEKRKETMTINKLKKEKEVPPETLFRGFFQGISWL